MYAHSHIYFTHKITGSRNPWLLFGSLFPDFHQTKALPSGFDHKVMEFMQYLKDKHPDMMPLAVGMTLHEYPIGVDRFIHQGYRGKEGYAFQFVHELSADAKNVFGFDDQLIPLATHFLIENAIEHKIMHDEPWTREMLVQCYGDLDKDRFMDAVSEFYNVDRAALSHEWDVYRHQTLDFDYGTYTGCGKAWVDCMERLFDMTADPVEIGKLIEKTQDIMAPTVEAFLSDVLAQCKKEFDENFPTIKESL
ncbi:hypothetical protein KY362_03385 [Candidatus Woesearchaeota archaeon]|nr:hypothetical protein [Candidatus Woesearchaeota archaeon]